MPARHMRLNPQPMLAVVLLTQALCAHLARAVADIVEVAPLLLGGGSRCSNDLSFMSVAFAFGREDVQYPVACLHAFACAREGETLG